jgi:hypothetical protein
MKTFLLASLALACALALAAFAAACDDDDKATVGPVATPRASLAIDKLAERRTATASMPTPRPTATMRPVGPNTRACAADDLNAAYFIMSAATGGQSFIGIGIGNKSSTDCQLANAPDIRLFDDKHNAVPYDIWWNDRCRRETPCIYDAPIALAPETGDLSRTHRDDGRLLLPGQVALSLTYRRHDGAGFCDHTPPEASAVQLVLPSDGGELLVDLGGRTIASCIGSVGVWEYRPIT